MPSSTIIVRPYGCTIPRRFGSRSMSSKRQQTTTANNSNTYTQIVSFKSPSSLAIKASVANLEWLLTKRRHNLSSLYLGGRPAHLPPSICGMTVASGAQALAENMLHAPGDASRRTRRGRRTRVHRGVNLGIGPRNRLWMWQAARTTWPLKTTCLSPFAPRPQSMPKRTRGRHVTKLSSRTITAPSSPYTARCAPVLAFGRAKRAGASAQALACGTRRRYQTTSGTGSSRAWKLFILAPRMLLTRTTHTGAQGHAELLGRAAALQRGEWLLLLRLARRLCNPARDSPPAGHDEITERKRQQTCAKV